MYKKEINRQLELTDFNQPMGLKMDPKNRWVEKAKIIPWESIEEKYAELFPSETGMPAKPLRTALGACLIQKQLGFSDRELVQEIVENPYLQYFIGLPGYQNEQPFAPSLMVEFRKRLTEEVLMEINEMIIEYNETEEDDDEPPKGGTDGGGSEEDREGEQEEKRGTLILDATCVPQYIEYPQDINLLNDAREKLEKMVDYMCQQKGIKKPRMYREKARKDYLELAKSRRKTTKKIRKGIRKQLQYVRRDLGYVEALVEEGCELKEKQIEQLKVIGELYLQQKYMYENKVHTVEDRIVSISQPYIRPIVRGKAAAPVEFGAKIDLSVDEKGMRRIEKLSFDAYNESSVLKGAIERYYKRTGHYPERVLVDKIYRTRENLNYCKEHGVRLSGPKLGRAGKDSKEQKRIEYQDNVDRIEVERAFSLAKRKYGLGCIVTKLDETTRGSIVVSIIAMNVAHIQAASLCQIQELIQSVYRAAKSVLLPPQNGEYGYSVAC